ncbi:MAG: hypothetical protein WEA58_15285 [Balneolaceae bacterium]
MEIDVISIVIGIVALSTFFVPIGLYQLSEKRKLKDARSKFKSVADEHGFHSDEMEVFRGGITMGIDLQNRSLMHVKNGKETVLNLDEIQDCKFYKTQHNEPAENDTTTSIQEMGIAVSLRNTKNDDLRLPIFKGKEGNTFGDESLITQRWIRKIKSVQKPVKISG